MDIEGVLAEANVAAKVETAAPEQETQATSEEAQVTETHDGDNQETDDISKKPDSELTPEQLAKREANRQSHLNRKLAKQRLRDENRELKARLERLEQSVQQKPNTQNIPDDYPKEENYENVLDYFKAVAKYEAKQELKAVKEQAPQTPKVDLQKIEKDSVIGEQAKELAKQSPEYVSMWKENQWYLNAMPETVQDAFYEAENAPLALYALMKEGKLDDLEDLSPSRIAMEIGRAEERGKAYLSAAKNVTNAPPPMSPLKGTSSGNKTIYNMPVDELLKHFNS